MLRFPLKFLISRTVHSQLTDKKTDKTIEGLKQLAMPIVEGLGLSLVAMGFVFQAKRRILNVTIHKKGSTVSLDDCEAVSKALDTALDAAEPPLIEGAYVLEVQSPGLDRTLKNNDEFDVFKGEKVELNVKEAIAGLGQNFVGELIGLSAENEVKVKNPNPLKKSGGKSSKKSSSKKSSASKVEEPVSLPAEISIPLKAVSSVKLFFDFSLKS